MSDTGDDEGGKTKKNSIVDWVCPLWNRKVCPFLIDWWPLLLIIPICAIAIIATHDAIMSTQITVTAFATLFIGLLARKASREQDLRSRSSALMDHQASAIDHLGSGSPVIQAAGITEMVWLIRGWTTLTRDSVKAGHSDAEERFLEHAQELVDLAYKQHTGEDSKDRSPVTAARVRGLVSLSKWQKETMSTATTNYLADLDFTRVILNYARLEESEKSSLAVIPLQGALFIKAHLQNANLQNANLKDANLVSTNLEQAVLTNANLKEAVLTNANLKEAVLTKANLESAKLQSANLEKAYLANANLEVAVLTNANLSGAKLKNAILKDADLRDSNLNQANFEHADLSGADLRGSNPNQANLKGARYDPQTTKYDRSFDPIQAGMVPAS